MWFQKWLTNGPCDPSYCCLESFNGRFKKAEIPPHWSSKLLTEMMDLQWEVWSFKFENKSKLSTMASTRILSTAYHHGLTGLSSPILLVVKDILNAVFDSTAHFWENPPRFFIETCTCDTCRFMFYNFCTSTKAELQLWRRAQAVDAFCGRRIHWP